MANLKLLAGFSGVGKGMLQGLQVLKADQDQEERAALRRQEWAQNYLQQNAPYMSKEELGALSMVNPDLFNDDLIKTFMPVAGSRVQKPEEDYEAVDLLFNKYKGADFTNDPVGRSQAWQQLEQAIALADVSDKQRALLKTSAKRLIGMPVEEGPAGPPDMSFDRFFEQYEHATKEGRKSLLDWAKSHEDPRIRKYVESLKGYKEPARIKDDSDTISPTKRFSTQMEIIDDTIYRLNRRRQRAEEIAVNAEGEEKQQAQSKVKDLDKMIDFYEGRKLEFGSRTKPMSDEEWKKFMKMPNAPVAGKKQQSLSGNIAEYSVLKNKAIQFLERNGLPVTDANISYAIKNGYVK